MSRRKIDPEVLAAYRAIILREAPIRIAQVKEPPAARWLLFVKPSEVSLPAVRGDRMSNYPMVEIEYRDEVGVLRLSCLYVPPRLRKLCFATALMKAALKFQRERKLVTMYLEALPYAEMPMSQAQLFEFYGRFGFVRCPGHPYTMHRRP